MTAENSGKGKFASLLLLFQGILLILFVVFIDYDTELLPAEDGVTQTSDVSGKKIINVFQHDIYYIIIWYADSSWRGLTAFRPAKRPLLVT